MKPEPAPRTGSSWRGGPPPPGAGMPKRLKKSLSGSSPGPPPPSAFSITSMLTTAGPYLATSGEKSGSVDAVPGVHCTVEAALAAGAACAPSASKAESATRIRDFIAARARASLKTLMSDSGVGRSSTGRARAPAQGADPQCAGEAEGAEAHDEPVSNTRERCEPGPGRDGRPQDIRLVGGRRRQDLTARPDDRRDPVVGGDDHAAALLESAHAGHLELLIAGAGVSEPGVVGDAHQGVRFRQHVQHVAAVPDLVADRRSELEPGHW